MTYLIAAERGCAGTSIPLTSAAKYAQHPVSVRLTVGRSRQLQSGFDDVEVRVAGLQDAEQGGELTLITASGEPVAAGRIDVALG
jgi:hypothetical protein